MPSASLLLHSTLLSGIAGYVDAAAFASLLGLFPAHLTGELVGDAIALSSGHSSSHSHLWAFPVFAGSVLLATLFARFLRRRGRKARAGLLALVAIALGLFSASDALARALHEGHLPLLVRGGFAVAAMGFQSALMRESLTGSCPTTVMTGNLTQVVIELVDHVANKLTFVDDGAAQPRSRLAHVASSLFVFALSAALGGWLSRVYGSISVALPTLLAALLVVRAWREDAESTAAFSPVLSLAPAASSSPHSTSVARVEAHEPWPDWACTEEDDQLDPLPSDLSSQTRLKAEPAVSCAAKPPQKRSVSGTRPVARFNKPPT